MNKKSVRRFDAMNSSGRIYLKSLWEALPKSMKLNFDINTESKKLQEKILKMSPEELKSFLDETSLNKIVEQFAQVIGKMSVRKTVREVKNV